MSRDQIIQMARQYGTPVQEQNSDVQYLFSAEQIECLLFAEREACAKVCDETSKELGGVTAGAFVTDFGKHTHMSMAAGAENCAAAIRARGQE